MKPSTSDDESTWEPQNVTSTSEIAKPWLAVNWPTGLKTRSGNPNLLSDELKKWKDEQSVATASPTLSVSEGVDR